MGIGAVTPAEGDTFLEVGMNLIEKQDMMRQRSIADEVKGEIMAEEANSNA